MAQNSLFKTNETQRLFQRSNTVFQNHPSSFTTHKSQLSRNLTTFFYPSYPMETHVSTPTSQKSCTSNNSSVVSKVRVVIRVRPFLSRELTKNVSKKSSCITVLDENCVSKDEVTVYLKDPETSRNECYQLDSFFGQDDNNLSKIYEKEVSPLIPGIFCGCNATVFAYGATGSGKTYTMQGTHELPGLMPLALSKILSVCQKTGSRVEISYYEVYMDRCYDLLEVKAKEILILDDKDGQTHLRGLSRVPVSSMSEFKEVLSLGFQRRKIAHTGLNDVSSRSHGVLVINVSTPLNNGSGPVVTGKLNLIDLAGNEDNRRTCNEGIRLQESAKINQSLFALSNVIYALNNNKPRVPYRESKLTRILQDSLGGNSRALMVACLNPGEYQESVHTVSLAARSRRISNFVSPAHKKETPNIKVDMEAKLRAWLESKGKTNSAQRTGSYVGTPFPTGSFKKLNYYISAKAKVNTNRSSSNVKQREQSVPSRDLSMGKDLVNSFLDLCNCVSEDNGEVNTIDSVYSILNSTETLPVNQSKANKEGTPTHSSELIQSEVSSPVRKALSPVNTNVDPIPREQQDQKNSVETKTPRKVSSLSANENDMMIKTPLDRFNVMSSALKNSLAQGYLDFLNTATREELIEIKGIGVKTAEYIIDLRETSPLKSLNDLEKIGLSYKQVHNMFNRAAKGLFDGATPNSIVNHADSGSPMNV